MFALCIICCCWVIKDLVYDILRDAEWENYSDDDFEEWIGDDEWDDMCDWDWDPYIRDDDGDFYDWGLVWLFEPEPVPVYENWDDEPYVPIMVPEMLDWDAYLRGDDKTCSIGVSRSGSSGYPCSPSRCTGAMCAQHTGTGSTSAPP
ncbi:uncharacterized protein LOC114945570 [Nylanderia fulva]|uniref:uncharacterized protein LOC114945570 n=1 Tax=Nylanderia fulva TaxID=613905 RepID=UPI0010FAF9C1|nr:uncharacterized protein LOC114945570 [Nylanderia fulva]